MGVSEIKGEDNKIYKPYEEEIIGWGIITLNGKLENIYKYLN